MKGKTLENSHVSKNTRRVLTAIEAGEAGNFSHFWSNPPIYMTIAISCSGIEDCDDSGELTEGLSRLLLRAIFRHRWYATIGVLFIFFLSET